MHVYIYIYIYVHAYPLLNVSVFVFVCTCTGKCVYEYLNLYAYVDVHMLTELYLQILSDSAFSSSSSSQDFMFVDYVCRSYFAFCSKYLVGIACYLLFCPCC